mmetsp:Transcript_35811/g.77400  ORF Transcript_35811/g.77400 Transcript_35811/m.77400 type:complete len:89 (-) Transcript_35811:533-799(-)
MKRVPIGRQNRCRKSQQKERRQDDGEVSENIRSPSQVRKPWVMDVQIDGRHVNVVGMHKRWEESGPALALVGSEWQLSKEGKFRQNFK